MGLSLQCGQIFEAGDLYKVIETLHHWTDHEATCLTNEWTMVWEWKPVPPGSILMFLEHKYYKSHIGDIIKEFAVFLWGEKLLLVECSHDMYRYVKKIT